MMTTLMHTPGLDRARPDSAGAAYRSKPTMWRQLDGTATGVCGTTRLAHATGAFFTTAPAVAVEQTINLPARPLGTRST